MTCVLRRLLSADLQFQGGEHTRRFFFWNHFQVRYAIDKYFQPENVFLRFDLLHRVSPFFPSFYHKVYGVNAVLFLSVRPPSCQNHTKALPLSAEKRKEHSRKAIAVNGKNHCLKLLSRANARLFSCPVRNDFFFGITRFAIMRLIPFP